MNTSSHVQLKISFSSVVLLFGKVNYCGKSNIWVVLLMAPQLSIFFVLSLLLGISSAIDDNDGLDKWGKLDPTFSPCSSGVRAKAISHKHSKESDGPQQAIDTFNQELQTCKSYAG
ncbi:hypothetical protein J1N35_041534 [Gossypium stocksii]|uniref:Alpha-carbonic anhydrase domain-containing protein n=1 Tax=Gossypium stocksii TaxID=47602 RepID=A0A9D3ZJI1_9ROSI|nr:hypothetical protein J1N35_041534 [Gossypium stocksii]